jgi:hypothetical protein
LATAPLSDTVDHVKPHKGDMVLFWDRSNWRAMAHGCNSAKAAREEGGFGNPRRAPSATDASATVSAQEDDGQRHPARTENLSGHPLPDRAMPTTYTAAGFSDGGRPRHADWPGLV